jgi:hypothetical protein
MVGSGTGKSKDFAKALGLDAAELMRTLES